MHPSKHHYNKQICNGEMGKIALHSGEMGEKKKQSGSCAMERDETGDM